MKRSPLFALLLFSLIAAAHTRAQSGQAAMAKPQAQDESAIRAAMDSQAAAWNRADIPAFMEAYEDSPETTFVTDTVRKGYGTLLERYKSAYPTPEQMGRLTFSNLEIRILACSCGTAGIAVVTGNFHLQRSARGEGQKDDGIFSLVWRKGAHGWKIVLDHTS